MAQQPGPKQWRTLELPAFAPILAWDAGQIGAAMCADKARRRWLLARCPKGKMRPLFGLDCSDLGHRLRTQFAREWIWRVRKCLS